MLGCFIPFHRCIDNIIHEKAGPRLREECRSWKIKKQAEGKCLVSLGYHLPAKKILHTVGPIFDAKKDQSGLLRSCYMECLDAGKQLGLSSIAFCCISSGVFGYPNKLAADIACRAVKDWIDSDKANACSDNSNLNYVVFNVFKDKDYEIYKEKGAQMFSDNFEIL